MKFDFTGAELFLAYRAGQASLGQVLDHPAYRTVSRHAQFFSSAISGQDIEEALHGKPSPFYGLEGFASNVSRIQRLMGVIQENAEVWIGMAQTALAELFPEEDLDITVYPIIGYDMGIGLNGAACLNCNCESYLREPYEFLFFVIHECVHVIYELHHRVQPLSEVVSPPLWRSYFNLWVQNEGYAVYAPLRLRSELGHLADRDYRVLLDADKLEAHRVAFMETLERLRQDEPLTQEEYLECCFGPMRLTYRIGCELIRRIERTYGSEAVRAAFYMDGNRFLETYKHLLGTHLSQAEGVYL